MQELGFLAEGSLHFISNAAVREKERESSNNGNDAAAMCLVCIYFLIILSVLIEGRQIQTCLVSLEKQ